MMNKFKVGDKVKIKRAPYTGKIMDIVEEEKEKYENEYGVTSRPYKVELNKINDWFYYAEDDLELIEDKPIEELKTKLELGILSTTNEEIITGKTNELAEKINEIIRKVNKLEESK